MVKKAVIAATAIIFVAVACYAGAVLKFYYTSVWAYSADFEGCESDFGKVKDYMLETYSADSPKWVAVANGKTLYDPDKNVYMDIPSDIGASLENICINGFSYKYSVLDVIRIYDGRVSFCNEKSNYALVYSPNEKPTWIVSPDEDSDVLVKKIGGGWYHVAVNPH